MSTNKLKFLKMVQIYNLIQIIKYNIIILVINNIIHIYSTRNA